MGSCNSLIFDKVKSNGVVLNRGDKMIVSRTSGGMPVYHSGLGSKKKPKKPKHKRTSVLSAHIVDTELPKTN